MCFGSRSGCILEAMRALVVLCLASACGDTGLMLEIHAGTSDVTSVEVFIPKDVQDDHMGLPMAAKKTAGTVYELADRVTATVSGDTQILLQPGSIDSVPELLVLGYDANHLAVRYSDVYDPAGPIQLPHTHADTIKVNLEAIAEVPVAGATMGDPTTGPRLARWSHAMLDDPSGDCVALLTDNGRGGFDGTFFSASADDLDCDNAQPECDDTWYLKAVPAQTPPDNPLCVRDDRTPDTMDACRVGNTGACMDNVGDCSAITDIPICVPAALCNKCNDQIDPSCYMDGITDDATPYIQCDIPVGPDPTNGNVITTCEATEAASLDLAPNVAAPFTIVSAEFDQPPAYMGGMPDLVLAGSTTTTLNVATSTGVPGMTFTVENGATPGIDSGLPDTHALIVITVHGGLTRALVLPFVAHYIACQQQTSCRLVQGMRNGQPFVDPIWHCSGT